MQHIFLEGLPIPFMQNFHQFFISFRALFVTIFLGGTPYSGIIADAQVVQLKKGVIEIADRELLAMRVYLDDENDSID